MDVAGLLDSETTLMEELCKYRGPSEWKEGKKEEGWTVRRRESEWRKRGEGGKGEGDSTDFQQCVPVYGAH